MSQFFFRQFVTLLSIKDIVTFMWSYVYSNDMFRYVFKAEFVMLASLKVPLGKQPSSPPPSVTHRLEREVLVPEPLGGPEGGREGEDGEAGGHGHRGHGLEGATLARAVALHAGVVPQGAAAHGGCGDSLPNTR